MAARTIDSRKDRLVTILVAPLVSCSARLPVYTLLIAVLLSPASGAWTKAGLMLALYLLGLAAAFGMAWLFRRTLIRGERSLLLLEMPPVPAALPAGDARAHVGSLAALPPASGHSHPGNHDRHLGALDLPQTVGSSGLAGPGARPERGGQARALDRAGHRPAGLRLEDRHRRAQFLCRARGVCGHSLGDLLRRAGGRGRPGVAPGAAGRAPPRRLPPCTRP